MKVYLDSAFNPTAPAKAVLVKVIRDNGRVTFYRPERPTQKAFNPDEARDEAGKWTSGSSAGSQLQDWTQANVRVGDKFNVMGRDGNPVMQLKITYSDPYKRFHRAKINGLDSNPQDREIAELFLSRERGGEITLNDRDLKYLNRTRRNFQKSVRPRGISLSEFIKGFQHESREHLNTVGGNWLTVARLVLDHLKENPAYYSDLEQKGMG